MTSLGLTVDQEYRLPQEDVRRVAAWANQADLADRLITAVAVTDESCRRGFLHVIRRDAEGAVVVNGEVIIDVEEAEWSEPFPANLLQPQADGFLVEPYGLRDVVS